MLFEIEERLFCISFVKYVNVEYTLEVLQTLVDGDRGRALYYGKMYPQICDIHSARKYSTNMAVIYIQL